MAALRARTPEAERWLLETHAHLVERVIVSLLGHTDGLEDHVQEVFVRVFARVGELREAQALRGFIASVAVFVAREAIRKRRRHRWLRFFSSEQLPEPAFAEDPDSREALRAVYAVLDEIGIEERLCFALRYIQGMDLATLAEACGCSLATVKRRLARADQAFVSRCRNHTALRPWLEEGDRWT